MQYGFKSWAKYSKFYAPSSRKGLFVLESILEYVSLDGIVYRIPEGFISDLGSVPRLLWFIIPRDFAPSSFFLHDDLCNKVNRGEFSRLKADQLLREALIASHAQKWKVWLIYKGVRLYAKLKGIN